MRQWVLGIVDNYRKAWVLLAIGCLTIELFMITPKTVRAQAPLSHDEVSHTISGVNEISPKEAVHFASSWRMKQSVPKRAYYDSKRDSNVDDADLLRFASP